LGGDEAAHASEGALLMVDSAQRRAPGQWKVLNVWRDLALSALAHETIGEPGQIRFVRLQLPWTLLLVPFD